MFILKLPTAQMIGKGFNLQTSMDGILKCMRPSFGGCVVRPCTPQQHLYTRPGPPLVNICKYIYIYIYRMDINVLHKRGLGINHNQTIHAYVVARGARGARGPAKPGLFTQIFYSRSSRDAPRSRRVTWRLQANQYLAPSVAGSVVGQMQSEFQRRKRIRTGDRD